MVRPGGQLIFDGGTLGNYATSDRTEAPQNLRLLLGGDPANDPNDIRNGGVITLRNAACRLQSGRLTAELAAGATLHLAATAGLKIDGARLTTLANSFLCVEPGAQLQYANGGDLTVAPGTRLGTGPGVVLNPAPACGLNACLVSGQLLAITGAAFLQNSAICPQPITLTVAGARLPTPAGFAYQWSYNGTALAGQTGPQLIHTPPANTSNATQNVVYGCAVQPPGGCPPVLLTYAVRLARGAGTTTLRNATPSICVPASGSYNLANLVASVVSSPQVVTWSGNFIARIDVGDPSIPVSYLFNAAAAWQQGSQHTLTVCNNAPGVGCGTCATVTLTLLPPPALAVRANTPTICPGKTANLVATVPAGTIVTWQPGNLTGASVFVSPAATTTYTATATNGAGCTSQRTLTIDVRPPTCSVCEPAVVQMNPTQLGNQTVEYSQGYTFRKGVKYYFAVNTSFINGLYLAEPGAVLLFGPKVYLTLGKNACLNLQGATLTATCDRQWGGIQVGYAASITAYNADKAGVFYNEVSHCQDGIGYAEEGAAPNVLGCKAFKLDGVRFRHNLRSVQLFLEGPGNAGQFGITNCIFEADPRQMLAPYAYQSASQQWCSYAHVSLDGQATQLQLEGNTFRGALFGIWAPGVGNVTAVGNAFSDCYVTGAFNFFNEGASTWNKNNFTFAVPDNDFINPANAFVAGAYAAIAALGAVPREISAPGNAVGLCASGEPLTLGGNQFLQALPLRTYSVYNPTPQTGLWAGPGTVALRNSTFTNLHVGAMLQAQQPDGGVAEGNTFTGCRIGLGFLNRDINAAPGDVKLGCNSFERPAGVAGSSFALYVGPGPYVAGQLGRRVNISDENLGTPSAPNYVPYLQTNRFTGVNPNTTDVFWHVYNEGNNTPFTYLRYNASANQTAPTVVPGDATVAGDGNGMANGVLLDFKRNVQYRVGVNDCPTLGYPAGVGLRPANSNPVVVASPYFLAQNVPNPCSGSTSVSYRLPTGETGELVVRDTFSGRVWLRQALVAGEHAVELRLEKLPPGAYHYSIEADGRPVAHHQLLVQ